jgi:hypothetical protein
MRDRYGGESGPERALFGVGCDRSTVVKSGIGHHPIRRPRGGEPGHHHPRADARHLAAENLRVARYALAQTLLALAQAIDDRGGPDRLAAAMRPVYEFVREQAEYAMSERPLHMNAERIYQAQVSGELASCVQDRVFGGLEA